jgi:selenoprotein W-related protein
LAAEIKKTFQTEPELVPGSGGVYKVTVDGDLIWDKHAVGRFPEESEILERMAAKKGPQGKR